MIYGLELVVRLVDIGRIDCQCLNFLFIMHPMLVCTICTWCKSQHPYFKCLISIRCLYSHKYIFNLKIEKRLVNLIIYNVVKIM